MKYYFVLFSIFSTLTSAFAQNNDFVFPRNSGDDAESIFNSQYTTASFQNPPSSPVRTAAEWEEIDALFIAWEGYSSILREIIDAAQEETQVYVVTEDSNTVINNLNSNGVPLTNVHFLDAPTNTIWIRDYGQWCIYTDDVDTLKLVDWIYNRPRPLDDAIPGAVADLFNLPIYHMDQAPNDMCATGGNFMVDGWGTAFSSELILQENDGSGTYNGQVNYPTHTEDEIDTLMKQFMGIEHYIKMETLPYDGIHHIDMHMKLLDEETLLVGEYPGGVADGPQIEANLQYVLSNYNSVFGTPYKVIRIPQPPDGSGDYPDDNGDYRTYANAVFVNKTILLPTYEEEYDTTALRIWRKALPGYNVVGINCNSIISSGGAIHCITKDVTTQDNLLITHQPLNDQESIVSSYEIIAWIKHKTGIASAEVYYRTDTTQYYQFVAMTLTDVNSDTWTGYIPQQNPGDTIYYYVYAQANNGKEQNRPMPAPDGYWDFKILEPTFIVSPSIADFALNEIYPNPSHGITVIPVSSNMNIKSRIYLVDLLGRVVKTIYEGELKTGDQNYFINTISIDPGIYNVVIEAGGENISQKLVVR